MSDVKMKCTGRRTQSEGQTTGSKCKLVKTATKSSAKSPRQNCKQEIRRLVKEAEESKQAGKK